MRVCEFTIAEPSTYTHAHLHRPQAITATTTNTLTRQRIHRPPSQHWTDRTRVAARRSVSPRKPSLPIVCGLWTSAKKQPRNTFHLLYVWFPFVEIQKQIHFVKVNCCLHWKPIESIFHSIEEKQSNRNNSIECTRNGLEVCGEEKSIAKKQQTTTYIHSIYQMKICIHVVLEIEFVWNWTVFQVS